jgi:XTP/dITP diphosphohydrolase
MTFEENSIIKSQHFSKKTKLICLADDSGLEIDILDKNPGIYSARWGGAKGNFKKAISRVYKELSKKDKNWKNKKVKARFICALSICYLDKKIASVSGKVEGYISIKPKGKNGFGYDPIFIPKNKRKTFGEMSSLQKYKIDHRFAAFKKIRKFL